MSGYDEERPAKRRRRDSGSSLGHDREETQSLSKDKRTRDRSPRTSRRHGRSKGDRDSNSRSPSSENNRHDRRDCIRREGRREDTARFESRKRDVTRYDRGTEHRDEHRRGSDSRGGDVHHNDKSQKRNNSRDRERGRNDRSKRHSRSRSPRRDRDKHRGRYREDHEERKSSRYDHGDKRENTHRHRDQQSPPHRSPLPEPYKRSQVALPSQDAAFTSTTNSEAIPDKQKPNFNLSGKLAAASNTIQTANQTIVLKYHEPSEARKPPARDQWRLYVFKDDEIIGTVELAEQSCWLFGREVAVADFPVEHPSCSKQHAVIQFRYIEKRSEFGDKIGKVKPYVIDLESANGTHVNGEVVPAAKYVELRDKDVVKFGHSTREYVIQLPPKE